MRRSVTQKDNYGCGVACLSFVANVSYREVIEKLGKGKAGRKGYYCKELVSFLQKLGLLYTYRYLKPRLRRRIYQEGIIVYIKKSKKYPAGHYLVRYQKFWMDPWINFPNNQKINEAKSGFRQRLPGKPIYAISPQPLSSGAR